MLHEYEGFFIITKFCDIANKSTNEKFYEGIFFK